MLLGADGIVLLGRLHGDVHINLVHGWDREKIM